MHVPSPLGLGRLEHRAARDVRGVARELRHRGGHEEDHEHPSHPPADRVARVPHPRRVEQQLTHWLPEDVAWLGVGLGSGVTWLGVGLG